MVDTSSRFAKLKRRSLGFTLIEIMIVIAVVGILAVVTVPKYQALTDHYHLESSAQTVAVQLRNAKQYAMDRRTDVYVLFSPTSVQLFYVDAHYDFISLETQQTFDSGITLLLEGSQGIGIIPSSIRDSGVDHQINNIPQNFDKCLVFNRKGFLSDPVDLVLNSVRTSQKVRVTQTLDSLEIKIDW